MKTFKKVTKRNHQEYFDLYVAGAAEGLEAFRQRMHADSGIPLERLDCSHESLPIALAWVRTKAQKADSPPPEEERPLWYYVAFENLIGPFFLPGEYVTTETYKIIDELAYYIAGCLLKNIPGSKWEIDDDPEMNRPYYHRHEPAVRINSWPMHTLTSALNFVLWSLRNPAEDTVKSFVDSYHYTIDKSFENK